MRPKKPERTGEGDLFRARLDQHPSSVREGDRRGARRAPAGDFHQATVDRCCPLSATAAAHHSFGTQTICAGCHIACARDARQCHHSTTAKPTRDATISVTSRAEFSIQAMAGTGSNPQPGTDRHWHSMTLGAEQTRHQLTPASAARRPCWCQAYLLIR